MRKLILLLGLGVAISAGIALAEIDLSDFDDELMKTMDDTNKYLEPDINAKNAKSAREGIDTIQQGLKWTEEYFANKGNTDDAVKLAQKGQQHIVEIRQALDASDFDKAAAAARELTKNCRACHDLYKPLTKG
jgi:hypothetical protein